MPTPIRVTAQGSAGAAGAERMRVANTDGVGVVLRKSPRDDDKTTRGLMDGASVSVLDFRPDWVDDCDSVKSVRVPIVKLPVL